MQPIPPRLENRPTHSCPGHRALAFWKRYDLMLAFCPQNLCFTHHGDAEEMNEDLGNGQPC